MTDKAITWIDGVWVDGNPPLLGQRWQRYRQSLQIALPERRYSCRGREGVEVHRPQKVK